LYNLSEQLNTFNDPIHLVDGFPMPDCCITRALTSKCFDREAGYGYCVAKDKKYNRIAKLLDY